MRLPHDITGRRGCLLVVLWLSLSVTVSGAWAQGASATREAAVKAGVVLSFTLYVDYPPEVFTGDTAPIELCVAEPPELYPILKRLATGKVRRGRPVLVRRVDALESLAGCHMLYFGEKAAKEHRSWLETIYAQPILTFGVSEDFLVSGGVIQLMRSGNNIRFAINLAAAEAAGLEISSSVLKLAESVVDHRKSGASQ